MAFIAPVADFAASLPHHTNLEGYWGTGDGTDYTDVSNTPRVTLAPIDAILTFSQLAARIEAVLGGDLTFQPQVGGVDTGATLVITAGQVGASGAVSFGAGRAALAADLQTVKLALNVTGSGTPSHRIVGAFTFATPFEDWCFLASGFSASQNLGTSLGNADAWRSLGATFTQLVAEDSTMLPWPNVPGTLQHFLAVRITNNPAFDPATFRHRLRINGATAIEIVEAGASTNPGLNLDDVSSAHVVAGDLVNFASHSDGPYGATNQSRVLYAIGFLPD